MNISKRQRYLQLFVIAAVILLLRFYPFLFLGRVSYFGDNYSLSVPSRVFTTIWLKQGILPWWNPYTFGGLSWAEDVSNSVFYPSTILFWVLSPGTALQLTLMAQIVVALVGMYGLSFAWTKHHQASLIAAVLWAVSTHVTGSLNNLVTAQSISWLPWMAWVGLYVGHRRWASLAFSVVVLIQFLAGYPPHIIYGIGLAVVLQLYRSWGKIPAEKWLWQWLVTGILTLAVTAVAWVPFVQLFFKSTRMLQTTTQASIGSLNPIMLIKPVLPYFFDKPTAGMKWGPAWSGQPNAVFYITWIGLTVISWTWWQAILSYKRLHQWQKWLKQPEVREIIFFSCLLVGSLLLALGEYLPGFSWLQQTIPFFRVSRYPSMVLMVTNLILALWVAVGLTRIQLPSGWIRGLSWLWGGLVVVGLVAIILVRSQFGWLWMSADQAIGGRLSISQFHTQDRDAVIAQVIVFDVVVVAGLAVVALWALSRQRWWLLTTVVLLDMVYNTQSMLFFTAPAVYPEYEQIERAHQTYLQPPFKQILAADARVLTRNSNQPYTDYGSYWEALVVRQPFSDSFVDRYELINGIHAQRLRDGLTPNWNMVYQVPTIHGYTTLVPQDFARLWQQSDADEVGINFIERLELDSPVLANWAVRYYLVDTWFKVEEDLTELPVVAQYQNWILYELPALSRFRDEHNRLFQGLQVIENPNHLELLFANQNQAEFLRIADRFDSQWRATVNGQPVQLEEYQGMRQLKIEPGENQVVLEYWPKWFYIGAAVSLVSLLLTTGWLVMKGQFSRHLHRLLNI